MFSKALAGVGVKVNSATTKSWGPTINPAILRGTTGWRTAASAIVASTIIASWSTDTSAGGDGEQTYIYGN